jgi:hypothetical protein
MEEWNLMGERGRGKKRAVAYESRELDHANCSEPLTYALIALIGNAMVLQQRSGNMQYSVLVCR